MCGRYSVIPGADKLAARFKVKPSHEFAGKVYNAAPTQPLPVITSAAPAELQLFRWGLVPSWADDVKIASKMINARAETLTEKPAFKRLLASRRCLVPADGFYEWKGKTGAKQPFRIALKTDELFAFAGLWDTWADNETGEVRNTFTIITTEANALLKPLHQRMPVILPQAEEQHWLAIDVSPTELLSLLKPLPDSQLKLFPVSPLVNSASANAPEMCEPVPELPIQGSLFD